MSKTPMVMVTVEGGIANVEVISGNVEVLQWDWDDMEDCTDSDYIEEMIEQAEKLPDDYWNKAQILAEMREILSGHICPACGHRKEPTP